MRDLAVIRSTFAKEGKMKVERIVLDAKAVYRRSAVDKVDKDPKERKESAQDQGQEEPKQENSAKTPASVLEALDIVVW